MVMFVMVLLVGTVSAFEFDNVGNYDEKTKTMKIKNAFGLGEDLIEAKLNSQTHEVIKFLGYVKIAEVEVVGKTDYGTFFNRMKSYNVKDNLKELNVNFDFKIRVNESYEFSLWNQECDTCERTLDRKEIRYRDVLENTTLEDLEVKKDEKIIIEIWTDVKDGDYVEWIPNIAGVNINQWASYEGSGGSKTTDGAYTIHTYTSSGTFNWTGATTDIEVLVVAGGGSGASEESAYNGGAGGAGGITNDSAFSISEGFYNITVGSGATAPSGNTWGTNGTNSSFDASSNFNTFGGGGGGYRQSGACKNGLAGGSGGGTAGCTGASYGGSGVVGQGKNGGNSGGGVNGAAGGGGAKEVGENAETPGGDGGDGLGFSIFNGTELFYGGGGGGAGNTAHGAGGKGGGGRGAKESEGLALNGNVSTGGGGGGGNQGKGGNGGSGIVIIRYLTASEEPKINLDSPVNNTDFTITNNIVMNATIWDDATNITNATLYLSDVGNETNSTAGINNSVYTFTKNMAQGDTFWTIETCNFGNVCINASQRVFSIDTLIPKLNIFFPNETLGLQEINTPLFVNWSVNDSNIDACVLQFQGVNTTQTCINNQTTIDINNSVNRSLIFYANDTFGNINSSSVSWNYNIFQNVQNFNTTSFETELNNFTINISYNSTEFTDIKTNLYYNSTKHPTTQTGSGNDINFSTTLSRLFNPPRIKPFFWNFRITNTTGIFDINSTEKNQVEQPILFGECNATLTTPYVNFTFKDEGNLSIINASVPTSTFVYSLGNLTINKTLTFVDNTELENFDFCLNPPNRTLYTDFSLQYEKGGYQQRIAELTQTFSSTLTTDILYLLSNADGLFVTFQVINTAEQTISGVIINASRIIDSVSTIVGTGITSDAGTKTFWLNPNFEHTIRAFKTGFPQFTTNLFPDQSSFTINLGGSAAGGEEDYTQGITVDISPKSSLLDTNDSVVFNYTLTSDFWTVTEFSFGLRDDSGNVYANETASTNGGTLTTTLNTTDNTTLIMDYNWLILGNYTNNSRSWLVYNDTLDNDWSILTFANHLVLYIDDGLFGLDDFGLGIILFLTIFIFTGVMSARFGLASPVGITSLMLTLVLFFDVGLGLMDNLNPVGAIPNFPSVIMAMVLAGVLMKDGIR